jgi:ketosteroid isomerase-like protein
MKKFHTIITLLFVFMFFFSCTKEKINIEQEKQKLLQTDIEFSKMSIEKGAAEAYREYFAEDAMQLPQFSEPVSGRDRIYKEMKNTGNTFTLQWESRRAEVSESGDMGWTWGYFTLKYKDQFDSTITTNGKYVDIWKKQKDGIWKVIVDIGN